MPICTLLKSVSKRQHSSLAKAWSGDLQTDWQSSAGETGWNRDRGQSVSIEGPSIAQPYLACRVWRHIRGFLDRYRGYGSGRCDQQIYFGKHVARRPSHAFKRETIRNVGSGVYSRCLGQSFSHPWAIQLRGVGKVVFVDGVNFGRLHASWHRRKSDFYDLRRHMGHSANDFNGFVYCQLNVPVEVFEERPTHQANSEVSLAAQSVRVLCVLFGGPIDAGRIQSVVTSNNFQHQGGVPDVTTDRSDVIQRP